MKKAKVVADYLGTVHHEIHYTVQEGIDALRDVIYHIETYDVTTIRASTPTAIAWDKKFAEMNDPSGRAVTDVHQDAYAMGHKM